MSADNPTSAIDALVGKTYEWRGKSFRSSMLLFVALERAGLPFALIQTNQISATAVGIYALAEPARALKSIRLNRLLEDATAYADKIPPVDFDAAAAIVGDAIERYFGSIATYKNEGSGGNVEAAADKSSCSQPQCSPTTE